MGNPFSNILHKALYNNRFFDKLLLYTVTCYRDKRSVFVILNRVTVGNFNLYEIVSNVFMNRY